MTSLTFDVLFAVVDNNQYDQPTAANLPSENECSRSDGKGLDEDKAKLASVSVDPLVVNFEEGMSLY